MISGLVDDQKIDQATADRLTALLDTLAGDGAG
jgi:hypothetical protein